MNYWVLTAILTHLFSACDVADGHSDGVCEIERSVPRDELEIYTEQRACGYYETCWRRTVRKTRTRVVFDTRTDRFCCSGYKSTGHSALLNRPICEPTCSIPCVNGKCVAPGTCECLPGFGKKKSDHVCEPICEPECVNAECVRDNRCSCYPGFDKDQPHSCTPHCTHGCVNGYCAQPEVCACNASYSLSSNGTVCLPVCSLECENGECIAPDRCECNDRYVEGETWNLCVPYCTESCENAICTAPDVCTCLEGYDQQNHGESHKCVPHCSKECINGECIAPEECGCYEGFDMDPETQLCVPVCSNGCDNGRCVSPEKCDCDDGYRNLNDSCVPHCHNECINGICTAPNECTCNNGTLKASSYHCLITCDNSTNDLCFHESIIGMPSALIRLKDDEPYVDFRTNNSLSVPCKYLSTIEPGFLESYYQCYTYLNFEEESLTVVCSVNNETMAASDSYQTRNLTLWLANTTSMQSQYMNVFIVHREVSRYCTVHLCSDSNRTLYLNALSTIRVCMDQHAEEKNTEWTSWMTLMIISGVSFILLVALVIVALQYYRKWKKVSYIVSTRHLSTSSQCGILEAMESTVETVNNDYVESDEFSSL